MKFKVQPSIYCPEGEWYLLCSVKDSSNVANVIDTLEKILYGLREGHVTQKQWDTLRGAIDDVQTDSK